METGFFLSKAPISPVLKRINYIGESRCKLFHNGQFKPHCTLCHVLGHYDGEEGFKAKNKGPEVIGFRSQNNILSNFAQCDIHIFGQNFKSCEHAYQWRKATDAGMVDLAESIKNAEHAGKAKAMSKRVC
jgi:hypothetical protein